MIAQLKITGNTAEITLNKVTRVAEIEWKEGHPYLEKQLFVGVLIGKTGSKAWLSTPIICRNTRYTKLNGSSEWVLDYRAPLNSINRNFCTVRAVAGWWDLIDEKVKSQR